MSPVPSHEERVSAIKKMYAETCKPPSQHIPQWGSFERSAVGVLLAEIDLLKKGIMRFPGHKAGLHLTHDQHKAYHESVEQWEENLRSCTNQEDTSKHGAISIGWVNYDQRILATKHQSFWELQWYPETPIGFHRLMAYDLDVLLEAACAVPANALR